MFIRLLVQPELSVKGKLSAPTYCHLVQCFQALGGFMYSSLPPKLIFCRNLLHRIAQSIAVGSEVLLNHLCRVLRLPGVDRTFSDFLSNPFHFSRLQSPPPLPKLRHVQ